MILAAAQMTPAGYIITYLFLPIAVISIPGACVAAWRGTKASKARAVALAENGIEIKGRLDTQDQALARILEVINPVGAPTLSAVLARIQGDMEAERRRLSDHIQAAAVDKALFDQRLVNILRPGGS